MSALQHVTRRRLHRRRTRHGATNGMFMALAVGVLLSITVVFAVSAGVVFATFQHYSEGYEPIDELIVERPAGITRVYDRTGAVELGLLNNPDAHLAEPIRLDQISRHLITATLSTEDNDFWDHPGVNPRGILRALQENYLGGNGSGIDGTGGSSITQQLVKNVYICPSYADVSDPCIAERTIDRKLREMVYAVRLERDHSKEDILNWYLNQISYGGRYIGIQAASTGYFRKRAADLTLAEAALLAGVPASPAAYHPRLSCVRDEDGRCDVDPLGRMTVGGAAKERQEVVLELMAHRGHITQAEAAAAMAEVILVYPASDGDRQRAAAFIDNQVEPRLVRMCEAGQLPRVRGIEDCAKSAASAGWSVITTLDWQKNEDARRLMNEYVARGLERGCDCHNAALITIEPDTGEITVYVPNLGGAPTDDARVAVDLDQIVEVNQPGSALKPAVYLAWFDLLGKTPASTIWDTSPLPLDPIEDVVPEGIEIVNPRAGGGNEGLITARSALGGSQNVPAFRAAQEVGTDKFLVMAKLLGIGTLDQRFDPTFLNHNAVVYGPSIATGGANVRMIDMAFMNATIANMGIMVGLPHEGSYIEDVSQLASIAVGDAAESSLAEDQKRAFEHGHLRLPGSRALDPIVILEVRNSAGVVIYEAPPPERIRVVEAGSVWMLHSILQDCEARWIIWACGATNDDTRLDIFVNGERLPAGIKTGTQQGPLAISDVLATWVVGYSRHAATASWVGNANKSLIQDGPAVGFASGHTVLHIYKDWMGSYHRALQDEGRVDTFLDFEDLRPTNVTQASFQSPTTERGYRGGCTQQVTSAWQRTDIEYQYDCKNGVVYLPEFKRDEAITLARSLGIPTSETRPRATSSRRASVAAPAPTAIPSTPIASPEPTPLPDVAATAVPEATPPPVPTAAPAGPPPTSVPAGSASDAPSGAGGGTTQGSE